MVQEAHEGTWWGIDGVERHYPPTVSLLKSRRPLLDVVFKLSGAKDVGFVELRLAYDGIVGTGLGSGQPSVRVAQDKGCFVLEADALFVCDIHVNLEQGNESQLFQFLSCYESVFPTKSM